MTSAAVLSEIQSLAPSAVIELFVVDLTTLGDIAYYFHAGTNELTTSVVWQGQTYLPFPAQATGFDYTTNGQLPRPKLALANVSGSITGLVLAFNDCVGAKVTRKRTLAKFLDAVNFTGGVNPTADPTAELPDDIYFIDRKAVETKNAVEFELTAAFDVTGVQLPRRQIIQNLCPWVYRGAECGYAGPPVADASDGLVSFGSATTPVEVAYVTARNNLIIAQNEKAAKLVLLSEANSTLDSAGDYVYVETQYSTTAPIYYVAANPAGDYTHIIWNSATVTLGATYRVGAYREDITLTVRKEATRHEAYEIERWAIDSVALAAATAAQAAAQTAYNTSVTALATAQTAYDAAVAALSASGTLYTADVCGKRLTSCKARFGEANELPFGGFPGAGVTG